MYLHPLYIFQKFIWVLYPSPHPKIPWESLCVQSVFSQLYLHPLCIFRSVFASSNHNLFKVYFLGVFFKSVFASSIQHPSQLDYCKIPGESIFVQSVFLSVFLKSVSASSILHPFPHLAWLPKNSLGIHHLSKQLSTKNSWDWPSCQKKEEPSDF